MPNTFHVSSSSDGYYVMIDSAGNTAAAFISGPHASRDTADTICARYDRISTNDKIDASKLLGAFAGYTDHASDTIEKAKNTFGPGADFSPQRYAWQDLDAIVCEMRELYRVFQEHVTS